MMLRVVQGKGGIDREVPLSRKLLGALREYYRWMRPETYLFPGTVNHSRADKPITEKIVWQAVHEATIRAGIKKRVTPHTLRHFGPGSQFCVGDPELFLPLPVFAGAHRHRNILPAECSDSQGFSATLTTDC
jgi:integrase